MKENEFNEYPFVTDEELKEKVSEVMIGIGISPSLNGFGYLLETVITAFRSNGRVSLSKDIYPRTAKKLGIKPDRVDRNIRTAVLKAHASGKLQQLGLYLGAEILRENDYLTNSELIAYLKELLIKELVYKKRRGIWPLKSIN